MLRASFTLTIFFLTVEAVSTPPTQKVVQGGFGSGGTWVESGNRLEDLWKPMPYDGVCQSLTSTGRQLQVPDAVFASDA